MQLSLAGQGFSSLAFLGCSFVIHSVNSLRAEDDDYLLIASLLRAPRNPPTRRAERQTRSSSNLPMLFFQAM